MSQYAKFPKKIKYVEQNENELMNGNVQVTNCEDIQHHCEQSNRDSTRRQASLSGLDAHTIPFEPAHTCNIHVTVRTRLVATAEARADSSVSR